MIDSRAQTISASSLGHRGGMAGFEWQARCRPRRKLHQAPAAGATAAEYPFGFKAYGVFSRMITQRNYLPVVALKDAADAVPPTPWERCPACAARFL